MRSCNSAYLVDHIQRMLALDERTHMLGISVEVEEERLLITGTVRCPARRRMIEQVVRELIGEEYRIVNAVLVEHYGEPSNAESLD